MQTDHYTLMRDLLLKAIGDAGNALPAETLQYARTELERIADEAVTRARLLEATSENLRPLTLEAGLRGLEARLSGLASILDRQRASAENRMAWQHLKARLEGILSAALDAVLPSVQALAVELLMDAMRRLAGRK